MKNFLLLILLLINFNSLANTINDLRYWESKDENKLVFDSKQKLSYKIFSLSNPNRLVIDFTNTKIKPELKINYKSKLINKIEASNLNERLRFMVELAPEVEYKYSDLEPNDLYGNRLLIRILSKKALKQEAEYSSIEDLINYKLTQPKSIKTSKLEKETHKFKQQRNRNIIVIIDAGHGGEDPGATYKREILEKDIVLDIAKSLAKELNKQLGIIAKLTRKTDYFIPLKQRSAIAAKNKADLFVSLHANSFTSQQANGFMVFSLSDRGATSAMARILENAENTSDFIGGTYKTRSHKDLDKILVDMSKTSTLSNSKIVGQYILQEVKKFYHVHNNIDSANFVVLRSLNIPSLLIETGFLSNKKDRENLKRKSFRNKMAKSIATGITQFFKHHAERNTKFYALQRDIKKDNFVKTAIANTNSDSFISYTIKSGDTLSKISLKFNTMIKAIKKINNLKSDNVYKGQKLKIPKD